MTKQLCELIALETELKALMARGLTQATILRVLGEAAPSLRDWMAGANDAARNEYATDEVELDAKPMQSRSDDGTWVSAWVYVSDSTLEAYNRAIGKAERNPL